MSATDVLWAALGVMGIRLPVLIAISIALVWTFPAPRGPARSGALAGLLLLGCAAMLGMLAALVPLWLVNTGDFAQLSAMSDLLGGLRLALELLNAFGLVLVMWALTRSLRSAVPRLP